MSINVSQTPNKYNKDPWYNILDTIYIVIQREPVVDS